MDRFLTMSKHVSYICKAASFALHKIGTLRQFLSQAATEKLVHALIMPRIDFWQQFIIWFVWYANFQVTKDSKFSG